MDTPLHALAVPEADRDTLKAPATAAREIADAVASVLLGAVVPVALSAGGTR
jgi:hypothetical protein